MAKLRDKHIAAVNAYFENGFNQANALRTAGYSNATATKRPQLVFHHPDVTREIERRKEKMQAKHELTQDWILQRFMRLADAGTILARYKTVQKDGSLTWDFTDAPAEDLALITEFRTDYYTEGKGRDAIEVKKFQAKHPDAHQALIALARHVGLFNDSLELKGGSLIERIQAGRDRVNKNKDGDTVH